MLSFPVAVVQLDTPYFSGKVQACVTKINVCDVVLGRIPGAKLESAFQGTPETAAAVQTGRETVTAGKPCKASLCA